MKTDRTPAARRGARMHRRSVNVNARLVTAPFESLEQRVLLSASPTWLSGAATWDAETHALVVTGEARIIADPGADVPVVFGASGAASLTIDAGANTPGHKGVTLIIDHVAVAR
jgi:hypothetical protein